MTSTDAATKANSGQDKDFPTSEAGVPLGHKGDGQPLPPVPAPVPLYAIPVPEDRADEDMLRAQSGTQEKDKDDYVPAAQTVAPDGPHKDEAETFGGSPEEREERRMERARLAAQPIMDVTPSKPARKTANSDK